MKNLFSLTILQIIFLLTVSRLYASPINSFIDNVNPKQNALNVSRSSDIHIVFAQDINAATINSANIKVFGMMTGLMPASIGYNAGTRTALINPDNIFKTGEIISVTLTSGIQTSSSVPVTPFVYTFTVQTTGGSGTFTESTIFDSTLNSINSYADADLDGDGDIDFVLAVDEGVKIYMNNGSAVFTHSSTLPLLGACCVGDFDNDGFTDILVKNVNLNLFKNDGLGNFTLSSVSSGGIGKIADLDGNGFLDVVYSTRYDSISVAKNTGGIFNRDSTYSLINISTGLEGYTDMDLVLNDFNNDGKIDIADAHRSGYDIMEFVTWARAGDILSNTGAGKFNVDNIFNDAPSWGYDSFDETRIASFNSGNTGNNELYFSRVEFTNNGAGDFSQSSFPKMFAEIVPGDYNGDGSIDMISLFEPADFSYLIKFFKNNGNGNFSESVDHTLPDRFPVVSGDFDNDGDLDLISFHLISDHYTKFSVLLNNDCIHSVINITGNTTIPTGTSSNIYSASLPGGNWELVNTPPCSAFITGTGSDGTVHVSSGSITGRFTLYYNLEDSCGLTTNRIVVSVDNPSPVELSSFTSTINSRSVTLNWSTSMEENNSGFDIERSVQNNNNWSKIAFVSGAGNSISPVNYYYEDKNLTTGRYSYRLKQSDFNGNFKYYNLSNEVVIGVPQKYFLSQNYPNPFNPVTNLEFGISDLGFVSLKVFDASGKEEATLVNEIKQPGYYTASFDGSNFSSGVYFYRIEAGGFVQTKKMLLLK